MSAASRKAMLAAIANKEPWHGDTVRGTPTTDAERNAYWEHIAAVCERCAT
jgi:hypothetical protein